jgi:hypothetical protein
MKEILRKTAVENRKFTEVCTLRKGPQGHLQTVDYPSKWLVARDAFAYCSWQMPQLRTFFGIFVIMFISLIFAQTSAKTILGNEIWNDVR